MYRTIGGGEKLNARRRYEIPMFSWCARDKSYHIFDARIRWFRPIKLKIRLYLLVMLCLIEWCGNFKSVKTKQKNKLEAFIFVFLFCFYRFEISNLCFFGLAGKKQRFKKTEFLNKQVQIYTYLYRIGELLFS